MGGHERRMGGAEIGAEADQHFNRSSGLRIARLTYRHIFANAQQVS
ncbi:hypothetical protein OG896_07955 [Streptomyces sp. NBC_00669]|nr:hypothetical protein [Streptomyces sp. NBC_00669]